MTFHIRKKITQCSDGKLKHNCDQPEFVLLKKASVMPKALHRNINFLTMFKPKN